MNKNRLRFRSLLSLLCTKLMGLILGPLVSYFKAAGNFNIKLHKKKHNKQETSC